MQVRARRARAPRHPAAHACVHAQEDDGAARGWQSLQSLPRVVTYNADLQSLDIQPIPELAQLRNATLATVQNVPLANGSWVLVPNAQGLMLELDAYISLAGIAPGTDLEVGFGLRANPSGSIQTRVGLSVSAAGGPFNNTDEPGGDYRDFASNPNGSEAQNVANCSAQCAAENECVAWTYVRPGFPDPPYPAPRCSLKSSVPAQKPGASCCVSGVKGGTGIIVDRSLTTGDGPNSALTSALPLLASETVVRIHAFLDHSILEVFGQGGRTRATARIYPTDATAMYVGMYALGGSATVLNATVWSLGTIWQ